MGGNAMRVLLAIDGSKPAELAVELVAKVAWPADTEILVADAVESGAGLFGGPWPTVALVEAGQLEADLHAEADRTVQLARERLARPGLTVEADTLRGRPATVIDDRARAMQADLIVVGARGHGTIESMVLGSVSAEIIDHASTPVLVARGSGIERIVLAWDGSASATRAADRLCAWPIFRGAHVRVVSVADVEIPWWTGFPEPASPEMLPIYLDAAGASREQHDQLARDMTARLKEAGLAAEPDRRDGDAATEILAAAGAFEADLIVIGTHGRTGLKRLLLGSVARNVLQHAACSVLVVREAAAAR